MANTFVCTDHTYEVVLSWNRFWLILLESPKAERRIYWWSIQPISWCLYMYTTATRRARPREASCANSHFINVQFRYSWQQSHNNNIFLLLGQFEQPLLSFFLFHSFMMQVPSSLSPFERWMPVFLCRLGCAQSHSSSSPVAQQGGLFVPLGPNHMPPCVPYFWQFSLKPV